MNRETVLAIIFIGIMLFGSAGLCQSGLPEASPNLEQILDALEKRYNAADFSADFFQESILKAMDITDTAAGKAWFKHPGMMRWPYEPPEKYEIITDGSRLWISRPADSQVVTGDALAYFSNGKGASFLADFRLVREMFAVSLATPDDPEHHYALKLIPLQEQLDISEIFVTLDKNTLDIVGVITLNAYGDRTALRFTNLNFEKDMDASRFHFEIPANADVVKLDE